MCLLLTLVFLGPRVVLFLWWLLSPAMWNAAFTGYLVPLLGIVFVPWATLAYVLFAGGGVTGIEWLWVGLGLAVDLLSYGGGAVGGRGRVGSYY